MTFIVDFNAREADGRVPSLLPAGQQVRVGQLVTAIDGEGMQVQAEVSEVAADGRYVMLSPVGAIEYDDVVSSASDRRA